MVDVSLVEGGARTAERRFRMMSESFVAAPLYVARRAANLIKDSLRQSAPERSGRLKREISDILVKRGTGYTARFFGPYYTQWVIGGRGPITKLNGFLHFWIGGREIFTHHVRAQKPNDFRIPALLRARPGVELIMHEAGVRTIRGSL